MQMGSLPFVYKWGSIGKWDADPPSYSIIWQQSHDPFLNQQMAVIMCIFLEMFPN